MNKKVGIVRCASYESAEVYIALKEAVQLAGDLDVAGKTVLLKPNILSDSPPEKAVTTHPVFLEAAIRLVREMGAHRVLVGDSPGLQLPEFSGKACGLGEAARKNNAEWIDFTSEKTELTSPYGKVMKKFTVTRAAAEADIVISLPKLKTHQLLNYTGAMKNLFGLVPSVAKSSLHVRFPGRTEFASMITDLNLAVKHAYAFMDAVVGMEGRGPGSGDPRRVGLVMVSSNLLALDIAASDIIGYPPLEIPVNRDALARGYWLTSPEEIEYPGVAPDAARIPDYVKIPLKKSGSQLFDFLLPRPLKRLGEYFAPAPQINHAACVRCGDCERICASGAIRARGEGKERREVIDYRRCIRCFCCHEICSANAIEIARRARNRG